jgi:hypothetical protein
MPHGMYGGRRALDSHCAGSRSDLEVIERRVSFPCRISNPNSSAFSLENAVYTNRSLSAQITTKTEFKNEIYTF